MRGNLESDSELIRNAAPTRREILVGLAGIALAGGAAYGDSHTSIDFTRIPQADDGGRAKNDIIEGQVNGGFSQHQIVLYAKSGGTWWVQPLVSRPFTMIQSNGKWVNATHLGTDYAALLVESGFRPQATMTVLPAAGGSVAAVATVKGAISSPAPSLQFSGYEWRLRNAPSSRGGYSRPYDPSNVWIDAGGAMHLRIAKTEKGWVCAETSLTRSLGYGTYTFTVRDTSNLDPAAVFTMFTWDYAMHDRNYSEMDIEISRWGDLSNHNAQYVIQPYFVPDSTSPFSAPPGTLKHSLRWEPGRVTFRTTHGVGRAERTVAEHSFASGIPKPEIESVRMNLYPTEQGRVKLTKGAEVVVERFEYFP